MKWLLLIPAILVSSCSSPSNNKIENKQGRENNSRKSRIKS